MSTSRLTLEEYDALRERVRNLRRSVETLRLDLSVLEELVEAAVRATLATLATLAMQKRDCGN